MKLKPVVLIILLTAVVALFTAKMTVEKETQGYSANSSTSQNAVLIEEAKQKGQPVWLLFHSTTCASCIEMEKVFNALKPEFEGKVAFIEINVNDPAEQELCYRYKIQYIPTTCFLNSQGEITFNYVGVIQPDEMRGKLQALAEGK